MKLTIKQKKFADEYIISGNATQSAIKAGYSKKTARNIGQENLTKPAIKHYLDERLKKLDEAAIADQKEVMRVWTSILRGERPEEVVFVDPAGGGVVRTTKKADNTTVIRAGSEIMKRYPLPLEVNVNQTIEIKVGDWDDDDED
ncbi:terminase small subunit [Streptococcus panodentis]|uniref:Terminase small subunit n=1 Tax=Streptococcus panodentis TaxID=1581472 RepID=A0ABS5AX32_9STRE|nr:terminase small subunit [Streptococcus panodentis]MBP2621133.1 terminase small subunit [Streptococcus panodentis]